MDERPVLADLAQFLRQRGELGGGPLVFETLSRPELAGIVKRGRLRIPESRGSNAPGEASPGREAPVIPGRSAPTAPVRPVAETRPVPDPHPAGEAPSDGELPSEHGPLRELALGCTRCPLCESRTQVVFHDGSPGARLMVVGEAPGANEDASGVPFVGAAGKFLDLLMASVGLSREDSVYICNVIKCRPPGNRNPKPGEIAACSPWLERQIELVEPEVILAVGTFSAQLLTGKDIALGRLRGEVYSYQETPLVVTYHPAALLRNSGWTRPSWEDFQLLRRVMDGSPA